MDAEVGPLPAIEVDFPDLGRHRSGNRGIPYVWSFEARAPGPHVVVQALTHGNEVCGAIAIDRLLGEGVRPSRGTLTFVFANVDAYGAFDPSDPYASRCVDEDFNRVWSADVLDGSRRSADLLRARELRPVVDSADWLLDLHSMTDPCPPLALAGRRAKGHALARAVGVPATIVIDGGHAAGRRLRDYAHFDEPDDPRAALLVECGQHWERAAPAVAREATLRFLDHLGVVDPGFAAEHLGTAPPVPQRTIEVTDAVTIRTERFDFALPVHGLMVVPRAGTLLALDGDTRLVTPYDGCVLIMPTRRPRVGETAVRLGRYIAR